MVEIQAIYVCKNCGCRCENILKAAVHNILHPSHVFEQKFGEIIININAGR